MNLEGQNVTPSPLAADLDRVRKTLRGAATYLRSLQEEDGHWCGELEGDTILESEYALTLWFLGNGSGVKFRQLALHLRSQQLDDGGWANFPGGPSEVSVSAKAYFVLKLAGADPQEEHMLRSRETIRRLGGLDATNSYTRLLLAIFGVYPWDDAPAVPPEIMLLPKWFYFNIYAMSSWSRAIVVPLSIVWAHKPLRPVPAQMQIDELRLGKGERETSPRSSARPRTERFWETVFVFADRGFHALEDFGVTPLRSLALRRAEAWVEARLEMSGGLGAIFPSIMNTVMAFVCRGRPVDDPTVAAQIRELERLEILDGDRLRLQPCFSPVWDTALSMNALLESGAAASDPALQEGARWLLEKEVRHVGDWQLAASSTEPGGWFFEYENEFYPDCDDTAEVIAVLERVRFEDAETESRRRAALDRATAWQLAMQSDNGGWGAFDRNCDHTILELVPFADHNAMIDPPTVDVTARSVEALLAMGHEPSSEPVRRAVDFLHREQEEDGSWYGRWGSNYLYGTWLALGALAAVGENRRSAAVRRGGDWLLSCQHDNGGWGESLLSYHDPSTKGQGPTTAAQTAWAVLGLLSAGALETEEGEAALRRAVSYLVDNTDASGAWVDESWTGTGFPGVFYLRYHLYACYFPIQALSIFLRAAERKCGIGKAA